jgi:hydroxyisourate hydrolase
VSPSPPPGLARFNTSPDDEALAVLHTVCAGPAWGSTLLAGRPYADMAGLVAASDVATAGLTDGDLTEAMAGHPPIGRPEPGDAAREQAGMAGASDELSAEMLDLTLAYQKTFGHVFLICATGATGEQLRDALKIRIGNMPGREREIARTELGKINRIRLTRLFSEGSDVLNAGTASVSTHILDTGIGRPAEGVAVSLAARSGSGGAWQRLGGSRTGTDGRCGDLPALPDGTTQARLDFETEAYFAANEVNRHLFPEVTVTFTVEPGEHHHVPLLLSPFGYSVYRGS